MKTFAITTLGCKVNSYESEYYVSKLIKLGYQEVNEKEKADIYIINTCTVTNNAASKSRKKISQAQRLNPQALICVVGCYVQVDAENLAQKYKIDVLVGSDQKRELPTMILNATKDQPQKVINNVLKGVDFEDLYVKHFKHQTRAFLKIQDGCNQFCSFCIIPYARGKERSLSIDKVINNLQALFNSHQEVVLAGIHTGRYHNNNINFEDLLEVIAKNFTTPKRIRISSIEINEITEKIIKLFQENKVFARHLHIPLQSGSNNILKLMKRHYSTEEFYQMLIKIKEALPDISISTDIIVGFPGESDADFKETKEFLEKCQFSFLHVFPYSIRENTVAASYLSQIDGDTKQKRVKEFLALSKQLLENFQQKFYNKEVIVLIERKEDDNYYYGHSSEYLEVLIKSNKNIIGTYQKVKIVDVRNSYCIGLLKED